MGVDRATPEAVKGARLIIDQVARYFKDGADKALQQTDLCVYGFYLGLGAVFVPDDPVLPKVAHLLHKAQMADGGWNCRMPRVNGVKHSSFHTTFNVLEGFRLAVEAGFVDPKVFQAAEARALEFMLEHRMFKSDKTGEIVNSHFTEFSYPPRWHYDVLRGMDYIRSTSFRTDPRLADALALIERRRNSDGTWPAQNKHAGKTLFTLESPPRRSRWNTLRALRVLKTCG
jgi:hypothetical protein